MNQGTEVICLACSNIFVADPEKDVNCPVCPHAEQRAAYDRIMQSAASTVRYGFQYPRQYASDRRAGVTDVRHCLLELPPLVTWLALAALSGVAGNATYDAIKTVIERLAAASARRTGHLDPHTSELLGDDVRLREFCDALREYNERQRKGLPDPDPLVYEERLVHQTVTFFTAFPEASAMAREMDASAHEQFLAMVMEASRRVVAAERPLEEDELARIWELLDSAG